jgi:hypothetical protein
MSDEHPEERPSARRGALRAARSSRPRTRKRFRPSKLVASDALGSSFAIWLGNLPRFFLIALLIHLPLIVAGWLVIDSLEGMTVPAALARYERFGNWESLLGFLFFSKLVTGTVTYAVVESLRGRRGSIGACFAVALRRLVPLVVAAVATALLLAIPIAVAGAALAAGAGPLVAILLGIPALVLLLVLFVVEPVVVVERPGALGLAALGRSAELTSGSRWPILGLLLLLLLCFFGISLLLGLVIGAVDLRVSSVRTVYFVNKAVALLIAPLFSVISAVVYYQLRRAKEGVDVAEIAKVFE